MVRTLPGFFAYRHGRIGLEHIMATWRSRADRACRAEPRLRYFAYSTVPKESMTPRPWLGPLPGQGSSRDSDWSKEKE